MSKISFDKITDDAYSEAEFINIINNNNSLPESKLDSNVDNVNTIGITNTGNTNTSNNDISNIASNISNNHVVKDLPKIKHRSAEIGCSASDRYAVNLKGFKVVIVCMDPFADNGFVSDRYVEECWVNQHWFIKEIETGANYSSIQQDITSDKYLELWYTRLLAQIGSFRKDKVNVLVLFNIALLKYFDINGQNSLKKVLYILTPSMVSYNHTSNILFDMFAGVSVYSNEIYSRALDEFNMTAVGNKDLSRIGVSIVAASRADDVSALILNYVLGKDIPQQYKFPRELARVGKLPEECLNRLDELASNSSPESCVDPQGPKRMVADIGHHIPEATTSYTELLQKVAIELKDNYMDRSNRVDFASVANQTLKVLPRLALLITKIDSRTTIFEEDVDYLNSEFDTLMYLVKRTIVNSKANFEKRLPNPRRY